MARKKIFGIHCPSIIIFSLFILSVYSCGDPDNDSEPTEENVIVTAALGGNGGTTPLYIYGPRDIDFSISSDKGNIDLVQFFYQGTELKSFSERSGKLHFTPDMSKEGATNLEIRVTVSTDQKKHYKTLNYEMRYVKISEKDFELKDATIDRFVFGMIDQKPGNYKYILNGKAIEDLNNIIIERKIAQYSFPTESNIHIYLVPKEQEYISTQSYPYVTLECADYKLGDFNTGSTLSHYMDVAHQELYIWSSSELSVFDKQMNEIEHRPIEYIHNIFVTPKTGLVVVKPLYGDITTYSDKKFSSVISKTEPRIRTDILHIDENDRLFNGHNFMIDVYDLHTGEPVYSLEFQEYVSNFIIAGDKLLVKLGNYGENRVYQLNEKSATLLYSFEKNYKNLAVHPINRNHIILDDTYNGFEVFDLDSQTSLMSCEGQFQSIDPVTGSLLYYDANYGSGSTSTYDNHVVDLDYKKIFTFEDASQSTYGAFLQFNNYIIKSDRYTHMLHK